VPGAVAWIQVAPVKGLALGDRREVLLERTGVRENRRFHLVDAGGRLVNGKVDGRLALVRAAYDEAAGTLELVFPDGKAVGGEIGLGEAVTTSFFGRPVAGRFVVGPWSDALSAYVSRPLRLVADEPGDGGDRGRGAASLLSTASLEALRVAAGVDAPVDGRRFRMLFGVDGVPAHEEDGWLGLRVRVGEAVVVPRGNVGRCAVTTQNPATGLPDLDTLRALVRYRGGVETTEPLPFGVWAEVAEPGRVRLGDPVVLL
jgi:uncharacterized protein YcbX